MSDLFDQLIEPLLVREGGYVNDPRDAGGETNFGVTVAVARENGFFGQMRDMTRVQASAIYRAKYWIRPGFHLVAAVSPPIAEELFDTGVNMGTGTASIWLQRSLNALNRQGKDYGDIPADGGIGQMTVGALQGLLRARGPSGESAVLKALNCLQGARYIELCESRSANEAFAFGWLSTRVAL